MMATPYQMEIIQQPEHKRIMMIFEGATHIWREIYMDGRAFPEGDALNPTYLGYSVGQWEGDTLVVENKGFNENSWLDYFGHPHTDQMHVIERWTRPNKGTLHYEATVTDPGAYTRPFTMAWDIPWREGGELPEDICQENNQHLNRLEDDLGQPILVPSAARTEAVDRHAVGGRVKRSRFLYVLALSRSCSSHRVVCGRSSDIRSRGSGADSGARRTARATAARSALGRQGDHGCRESGEMRATVKAVTFDYSNPVSVEGQDDGRGQGQVRASRSRSPWTAAREHRRLQQLFLHGTWTEGRPEGRVHAHAKLVGSVRHTQASGLVLKTRLFFAQRIEWRAEEETRPTTRPATEIKSRIHGHRLPRSLHHRSERASGISRRADCGAEGSSRLPFRRPDQGLRRPAARERSAAAQVPERSRHRRDDLLAARVRDGAPHRRRARPASTGRATATT